MHSSRSSLLKQLAVAVIGQALPQESVLSDAAADFRKGLVATLVMGILSAALILFGCFEFYSFLLAEGLDRSTVSLMTFGLLVMLIAISGLAAAHYSKRVVKVRDSVSLLPQSNDLVAGAETMIAAFMRGFNSGPDPRQVQRQEEVTADMGRAYAYAEPSADDARLANGRLPH